MLLKAYAQPENNDNPEKLFDKTLQTHVNDGHVNYAGIQKDPGFPVYIEYLRQINPDKLNTDREKLAFWINAYNALSIKGIIDGLSPSTFFGRRKFFRSAEYEVGGKALTLDTIEKEIIASFNDPRFHFAIVCASASCPKLLSEAYTAEKLDEQFDKNTRDFLNNPNKNRFDNEKNLARLSKIFDWFAKDFENHSGSIQKYIAPYINDPNLATKLKNETVKIKFLKYDWSLNGEPPT